MMKVKLLRTIPILKLEAGDVGEIYETAEHCYFVFTDGHMVRRGTVATWVMLGYAEILKPEQVIEVPQEDGTIKRFRVIDEI